MSTRARPPSSAQAGRSVTLAHDVAFPKSVIDGIHRDISQAHCSLGVLVELLRGNGQPDPMGLAHVLSYIENALVASDEVISKYMHHG